MGGDTGGVHHACDGSQCSGRVGEGGHRSGLGDIGDLRADVVALVAQLLGDAIQRRLVVVGEQNRAADARAPGDGQANAGRPPTASSAGRLARLCHRFGLASHDDGDQPAKNNGHEQ
jgi:hypothetical protein